MDKQPHDPPPDLTAVAADDALLDALPADSDSELTQALIAWRAKVDSDPAPRLLDVGVALAVLARAQGLPPRQGLLARLRAWLRGAR